jgi:hypothetical protein
LFSLFLLRAADAPRPPKKPVRGCKVYSFVYQE